jgi:hypothetical protein
VNVSNGSKLPFLPFYLNDWETDEKVRRMGPACRYFYLHFLMCQWREGSIPSDRRELLRMLRFPCDYFVDGVVESLCSDPLNGGPDDWLDMDAALGSVLECFEPDGDGRLVNRRLESLRKYHLGLKKAFSNGANKTNKIKNSHARRTHSATPSAGESESDTESEPRKKKKQTPQAAVFDQRPYIDAAHSLFVERFRVKPSWTTKDYKQANSVLKVFHERITVQEFLRRFGHFIDSPVPFHIQQGGSLAWFCQHMDSFINPIKLESRIEGGNGNGKARTAGNREVFARVFNEFEERDHEATVRAERGD